jgi:hypothetical protein
MVRATPRRQALKKSNRPAAVHETDLILGGNTQQYVASRESETS